MTCFGVPRRPGLLVLQVLALGMLLLCVSPRSLSASQQSLPRTHGTRRPRAPRHLLPEFASRTVQDRRKASPPEPRKDRRCAEDLGAAPRYFSPVDPEQTKPDYLHLFEDPIHQTSPPA